MNSSRSKTGWTRQLVLPGRIGALFAALAALSTFSFGIFTAPSGGRRAPNGQGQGLLLEVADDLAPGDSHDYQFDADEGDVFTIVMKRLGGELDPYLRLLGPDGQEVAADDDGAGDADSQISITIPICGVYTAVAGSYRSATGGEYSLTITSG